HDGGGRASHGHKVLILAGQGLRCSQRSSRYWSSMANCRLSARYDTRPWRWRRAIVWVTTSANVICTPAESRSPGLTAVGIFSWQRPARPGDRVRFFFDAHLPLMLRWYRHIHEEKHRGRRNGRPDRCRGRWPSLPARDDRYCRRRPHVADRHDRPHRPREPCSGGLVDRSCLWRGGGSAVRTPRARSDTHGGYRDGRGRVLRRRLVDRVGADYWRQPCLAWCPCRRSPWI